MSVVKEIVRFICGLIDGIAYDVISAIYNVFYELVNIIMYDREAFDALGKRIGLILGIIMLFRLAISLISYIINPDKMKDNNQGVKKIITNVAVSLVLLATINIIFEKAYVLQKKVIETKIVEKILFGEQATVTNVDIAYMLYTGFVTPNTDILPGCDYLFNATYDFDETCSNSLSSANLSAEAKNIIKDDIVQNHDFSEIFSEYSLLNAKKSGKFIFNYTPIISTVAAVVVILILISFCMDTATRMVKLMFYQIIAPIPIIANMMPGKGAEIFKKWYKECLNTYLAVFLRIIALNFAIFMITLITVNHGDLFVKRSFFVTIFIIIGCLMFAKQLPKLIEEIFGIKSDGMLLHPLKKFQEQALFGKNITSLGAAGLAGAAAFGSNSYARTSLAFNKLKNREFKEGFKQLGLGLVSPGSGLISATSRGIVGAIKGQKFGQVYSNAYSGAINAREKRDERRNDDVGFFEMELNKLQRTTKQKTRGQRADALDSVLEEYKKNGEAIKNAIFANDKASFSFRDSAGKNYNFDGAKGLKEFIDNMQGPTQAVGESPEQFARRQQKFIAYKKEFQDELDRQVSSITTNTRTIDDNNHGNSGGAAAQAAVNKMLSSMNEQLNLINKEGTALYGEEFKKIDSATQIADNHMSLKNSLGAATGAQTTIRSHAGHDRDVDKYGAKKDAK